MEDKTLFMRLKKPIKSLVIAMLIMTCTLTGNALSAKTNFNIAVFHPEVRKPFSTFFETINSGIKKSEYANISIKSISKSDDAADVSSWLQENKPDAIILLGSSYKRFSNELAGPYKLIYGASFFSNEQIKQGKTGITIAPDPSLLFSKLKAMVPKTRNIDVVYQSKTNGWLVDKAQISAKKLGITLIKHPVENIQQAALAYKKILESDNKSDSALWLLQHDPTLDEKSLLPKILSDAWKHQQIVFSSSPTHVRRGALFSLLPDNHRLGQDLAKKAVDILNGTNKKVQSMRSALVVGNIRTAKHLALYNDRLNESHFALVYPRKR